MRIQIILIKIYMLFKLSSTLLVSQILLYLLLNLNILFGILCPKWWIAQIDAWKILIIFKNCAPRFSPLSTALILPVTIFFLDTLLLLVMTQNFSFQQFLRLPANQASQQMSYNISIDTIFLNYEFIFASHKRNAIKLNHYLVKVNWYRNKTNLAHFLFQNT